jgi:hypothetical protein
MAVEPRKQSSPVAEATFVRQGLFAPSGMHSILGVFRRENIVVRGNSIVPFSQPCVSPDACPQWPPLPPTDTKKTAVRRSKPLLG